MSDHKSRIEYPSHREIVSARNFAAPREEVFRAFSDPVRLAQWWGPKDFTNAFQTFDLRPGGAWRFVMHGPKGEVYEMNKQFIEVLEPERVVLRHEQPGHGFQMTMIYTTHGTGTTLTWRMLFDSAEEVARIGSLILEANEQNFDRLQAHLDQTK